MGWGAAITAALKVIMSIMGYFMKRADIKMETKKKYYEYVEAMASEQLISVGMKEDLEAQRIELNKEGPVDEKSGSAK